MTADDPVRPTERSYTDEALLDAALAGDSPTVYVVHDDDGSEHPRGFARPEDPRPLESSTPHVRRQVTPGG
jgi:hypothetical protein